MTTINLRSRFVIPDQAVSADRCQFGEVRLGGSARRPLAIGHVPVAAARRI
jgi:hypothetical protein